MPLQPGDSAPAFTAVTDTGEKIELSDLRGKKVIIYFYPKDDTPGCTTQACGFRDQIEVIEEANAVVLGVSPDGEASHVKFKSKFDLPFTLLVDADRAIAEKYGALNQESKGIIRSHFVIDEGGKILEAKPNVKPEDSVTSAIAAVSGE
jgi:thioredoxin-dependent peroxiredoxin